MPIDIRMATDKAMAKQLLPIKLDYIKPYYYVDAYCNVYSDYNWLAPCVKLHQHIDKDGRRFVNLYGDDKRYYRYTHRLAAMAFGLMDWSEETRFDVCLKDPKGPWHIDNLMIRPKRSKK